MNKKELDKAGRKHREDLCDEYLGEPDRLPLLVFSDEKLFKRSQNKNKVYVRRRKGTAHLEKHINFYKPCGGNADCNVFLYITRHGKGGLYLAERTDIYDQSAKKIRAPKKGEKLGFDGDSYYEMMRDYVLPSLEDQFGKDFEWMQDNAPIHKSENLKRYSGQTVKGLLNDRGITLVNWPPNSPDLNPVEHVWTLLNRLVKRKMRKWLPKNKQQMWRLIKNCWTHVKNEHVVRIYDSFMARLLVVKANRGSNNNKY